MLPSLLHFISSALFRREITGEGLEIDLSMLDAAFMLMTSTVSDSLASGISKPSYGNNHPDYAGYGAYNASDRMIVIGAFSTLLEWAEWSYLFIRDILESAE